MMGAKGRIYMINFNSAISVSLVNGSRKFKESSYEWNPLLCGPPLPKSCSEDFYKRNVENIPKF